MAQEFKLKSDSLSSLKNGQKIEAEVEGIEEGKVVVVKHDGKLNALSSKCTHYGAPMIKGVVSTDGRLTCPWHGACFNVSTGDVEDAPAIDALGSYAVSEKNGAYYITGDQDTIKASRRKPNVKCTAAGQEKVVIVGGGSGAIGTIEALREDGYKGGITVISKEPHPPIDRTKLSKALIADHTKIALRDADWFSSASVDFLNDEVTGLDTKSKNVTTGSGKSYPYTKLVLASGGTPRALPLPGFKDLGNVFVLRAVADVQAILGAVGEAKGKKIVVIGSSFIGMEVGNALAKENDVTVVGMESAPLERIMGAEVGSIFQGLLEKNGVKFKLSAGVEKAVASDSSSKSVGAVHLKDGTVLPADLVVLGVGVSPATEYIGSALSLEKDKSIKVDETFAVPGTDNTIFAIGDIASYPYHGPGGSGSLTRIEHWNVAQNAGRVVASIIADTAPAEKKPQFIPVFWSALGAQLRYCGNTPNGWDELVLQGKPKEGSFSAFYTRGETVVAVATMAMDPVMAQSASLMRSGQMPTKSELKNGADVLKLGNPAIAIA